MTAHGGISVDPNLLAERQQSMSCYVVTAAIDEAAVALLAVRDRLFRVDGEGREYPDEDALIRAVNAGRVYTPNAVSDPVTRRDGAYIWLDTKGDTSAEMAATMVSIIIEQLMKCGVTEAHLRPITRSDIDDPGISDPVDECEPLAADADDPDWVELNALLIETGVPFEAMSPHDRRARAAYLNQPPLKGYWLARWPNAQLPAVVVSLYETEQDARAEFDSTADSARLRASPRASYEVRRLGRIVVLLSIDSWNPAADQWLDRVRQAISGANATREMPRRAQGEPSGN